MYILFNLWWEDVLLRSICEQAQNSEPHLIVCVLQVNDSMLVDCHWSAVFLTLSLSCCCWPQLRRAIPAPCCVTGLQLLAITPTSCCLRGLRQCCCWAGHGLLRLMLGGRLVSHSVSPIYCILDSRRHATTIRWAPWIPFSLFYVLCPSSCSVTVLRLCAVWFVIVQICSIYCCYKKWILIYVFLFAIISTRDLICGFLFITYTWLFNWTSIRPSVLFLTSVAGLCAFVNARKSQF
jgi:hypothetical protein